MRLKYTIYIIVSLIAAACSSDNDMDKATQQPMLFDAVYPTSSRATATAFETGDRVGVFVVADSETLEIAGNKVNNEPLAFNGSEWTTNRPLYWDDGRYNVYAYYPYSGTVSSVDDYPFSVLTDQSATSTTSDFIYAATENVTASDGIIPLHFRHIMSRLVIRLIKGEDFEGEMPRHAEVFIHNTVPDATINLSKGIATKNINAQHSTIKAHQDADYIYSAIIIPQRLQTKTPLLEISINNVSYLYESSFIFKPGTQHIVNFIIDKNPEQSLISIGGEINGW